MTLEEYATMSKQDLIENINKANIFGHSSVFFDGPFDIVTEWLEEYLRHPVTEDSDYFVSRYDILPDGTRVRLVSFADDSILFQIEVLEH